VPGNEENYITNQFIGHKSLKAWKIEHEKEVLANESKNRKKSPKGAKSPPGAKDSKGKESKLAKDSKDRPKSGGKSTSPTGGKPGSPKPKGSSRESSPKGKVKILFFCLPFKVIFIQIEINK
jgi:hypothetical protein